MTTDFSVTNYVAAHGRLAREIDNKAFQSGIDTIVAAFEAGSAYTASHYITDWNKMCNLATGRKFRGLSLCDNIGLVTAFGNDLSYDEVFSGQLRAILDEGDLLIAVSGSGNSPNVLRAVEFANKSGAHTLAVVGYDGGKLKQIARQSVWVPCFDMQLCEDVHLMFGHMVMKTLCKLSLQH
jgi:D-sedoheptulose 7-phosphate isomerase